MNEILMSEEENRDSSEMDSEKVTELWSRGTNEARTVTVRKLQ